MKVSYAIALTAAACTFGCAHAPPPAPVTERTSAPPVASPQPAVVAAPAPAAPAPTPETDVAELLRGDVLHFGFDQAELTPESRSRLQHVAEVMKSRPGLAVTIAGNTDERGTEEYNLALAQRRAEVARKYLVALGIEVKRVKTLSYGKERPADPGHGEDAWAANRRDELTAER